MRTLFDLFSATCEYESRKKRARIEKVFATRRYYDDDIFMSEQYACYRRVLSRLPNDSHRQWAGLNGDNYC